MFNSVIADHDYGNRGSFFVWHLYLYPKMISVIHKKNYWPRLWTKFHKHHILHSSPGPNILHFPKLRHHPKMYLIPCHRFKPVEVGEGGWPWGWSAMGGRKARKREMAPEKSAGVLGVGVGDSKRSSAGSHTQAHTFVGASETLS